MTNTKKFLVLDSSLYEYVLAHGQNEDPLLTELSLKTQKLGRRARMQIAPEQGKLITLLASALGAKRAVEIGTFTAYSAICIARALPADGNLLCCDVSEEWTSIARPFWDRAGVANRITLKLAPASDTLRALPLEQLFDFAFIDADKTGYFTYYEEILQRMRPGGLILADNVLRGGAVIDATREDEDTRAIRAFNDAMVADQRVEVVMLAIADGLIVARKR